MMKTLVLLTKQHKDLPAIADQIITGLGEISNANNTKGLLNHLKSLDALLTEHLKLKDDLLYPVLKRHPQENIRDTANRFAIEFGSISSV